MARSYVICPTCQALNARSEPVCEQCGASTAHAESTEPSSISAAGLPRIGVARPWRKILLVGLWMVFLPAFLSNAYAAIYFLKHRRGLAEFIFFWGSLGLTCLAFTILYRATRNHLRAR
jgi:hypothetical protein